MSVSKEEVLDALADVRDPELDEPVTTLGFISNVEVSGSEVSGSEVSVTLRLPTFFCSPNFAYIMAEDAKREVEDLAGVDRATILLENFHVSEEIESGVSSGAGFDAAFTTFSPETNGEDLREVRDTFKGKAFIRRQEILCRLLMRAGATPSELSSMTLGEVAPSEERDVYIDRREELGFEVSGGSPLLLDVNGRAVPEDAAQAHLGNARLTRISVEGNGMFCQELLAARYAKNKERLGA